MMIEEEKKSLAAVRLSRIIIDCNKRLAEQYEKWGEQNHPAFSKHLKGKSKEAVTLYYEVPTAEWARTLLEHADLSGKEELSWGHILVEEMSEVIEEGVVWWDSEERSPSSLYNELLDVAGVAMAWMDFLLRTEPSLVGKLETTEPTSSS